MASEKRLTAVRGATTLSQDNPEEYHSELVRLVQELVSKNHIEQADFVNIFFTVTSDLHSANPARIVREHFEWNDVPIMCAQEPDITGYPPFCIRIMLQYYTSDPSNCAKPHYLNAATTLRPDLA